MKRKSDLVSRILAISTILYAALVMLGWVLDVSGLRGPVPGQVTMKANTAMGFILSGTLLLVAMPQVTRASRWLRLGLEACLLVLSVSTLAQYLFGIDLHIDEVISTAPPDALRTTSPGRMAPTTALSFALFALAIIADHWPGNRALMLSRSLAVLLFLIGLTSLLGYAYGAPVLYLGIDGITAMAMPSSVLFMALGVGAIWLRPRRGFPALVAERSLVGTHARSLLPMVIGAPLLVGAAVAAGYGRLYEGQFAIALTSLGSVIAAGIVAIVSVIVLRRAESALYLRDRALSATTNGVVITDHVDAEEPIVFVNNAFSAISGYSFEETVRRNCRFMNEGVSNDADTMNALRKCLQNGDRGTFELRNVRKDGRLFWNRLSLAPVEDYGGAITHFVGIVDDVTEIREQEERIQAALDDAREANSMRDTFVRLVSHELRTPLNAALTWIRLLELDDSAETRAKGLRVVAQSIESQSRLIEDLVDVSRFASAGVRLEAERVDAGDLIQTTVEEMRPGIESQQTLNVTITPGDYTAIVDPLRVQQIVRNLLSNANKYTPEGGQIDVDLRVDGDNLIFAIKDSGIGMSPEQCDKVFEPFWRAESHQPGLGVGLAIVAALVQAHNGSIYAASDGPGEGSMFIVRLPLDAPTAKRVTVDQND
ncbi:MAG: PAS domain-containing protein [Gammaproteobacteria bacterium]|nr:PAS domain-containing protein [Gammaproteobacteria bacterium]